MLTGAGCITAIGQDVDTFGQSLFDGCSGIRDIDDVPAGQLHFSTLARVRGFVPSDWVTVGRKNLAERSSQFAIASARQALTASGLMKHYAGEDVAVVFGCSVGGRTAEEPETARLYTTGARVHPLTVPRAMASAGTSLVCIEHGITGPAYTISTACASSAHAIGQAFHMVRCGMVQAAVTGGHEAPLTYGFLKGWDTLNVVSPTFCKPFAADRDGMTLGEGAAVFTLEALDAAEGRGAAILAEIVGFGMSSDASHLTQPQASGAAAAMSRALRDAASDAVEVGYINAHGTGTQANDKVEAEALYRVLGDRARTVPVSSTKSLHGHAMGASGAIELLATTLALQTGLLPAAGGLVHPDEALKLDAVLRQNTSLGSSLALCNSFAFGGLNAVIAMRRYVPRER